MNLQNVRHKLLLEKGFSHVELLVAIVVIGVIAFAGIRVLQGTKAATACAVDSLLVNSCRPWLGASSDDYGVSGFKNRILDHEKRIGRQLDLVHSFHSVGDNSVSADEKYFYTRANTSLLMNWKPAPNWSAGSGSNASVNAGIDSMADSIKSLGSKKVLLVIWHEPNNDVSSGATNCPSNVYAGGASAGTPAQYRAMWQNVRNRFDAKGVNNVVWGMIYQSQPKWDCMLKDLYPGDKLVDWVMWDQYFQNGDTFDSKTTRYTTVLKNLTDATHSFTSKPWGVGEWGGWQTSQADVKQLYVDMGTAVKNNKYPNIKAYAVFDSVGTNDSRISFTNSGVADSTETASYIANIANNPMFNDGTPPPPPPSGDTTKPTVSITNPVTGATVSNSITVNVTATDNVAVSRVKITWDGNVIRDNTAQGNFGWGSAWNTANAPNGSHVLTATAYDAAGNVNTSSVTVKVANGDVTPPTVTIVHPSVGDKVNGSIVVNVNAADNVAVSRVVIKWDNNVIRDNTVTGDFGWGSAWNSANAPNGYHTLTATAYDAAGNTTVSNSVKIHIIN